MVEVWLPEGGEPLRPRRWRLAAADDREGRKPHLARSNGVPKKINLEIAAESCRFRFRRQMF
jgi:hypothetical protein